MNEIFKISEDKIDKLVSRDLRLNYVLYWIVVLIYGSNTVRLFFKDSNSNEGFFIASCSMFIIMLLSNIFLVPRWRRYRKLYYQSYRILLNDEGISKDIQIDENVNKNGLVNKWAVRRLQNTAYQGLKKKIKWEKIKSINVRKKGLVINSDYRYQKIVIHPATERFEEIEGMINKVLSAK